MKISSKFDETCLVIHLALRSHLALPRHPVLKENAFSDEML